ncbi:MAG: PTS sugar transporter subunit IIC [candidate division WOR-3 bacterium]|nr:PTS sugar transporter subunit IIC [candidate division WOR-3 bacterium]
MNILLLALIGALLLLDKYAFGEFGLSQPVIAGTIIGSLCGDVATGIFIGALFQMVFLANLPIGKDVPPDAQAAGIAGAGSYFILKETNQSEPNLMVVVLVGILISVLGSLLDTMVRRVNEKLFYQFLRDNRKLYACHFTGLFFSFLRGMILFLPTFLFVNLLKAPPILQTDYNKEFLLIVIVSLGIANGIYLYLKRESFYFLILGVLCTLVFFVL